MLSYCTFATGGSFHEPSKIDGGCSFGQYIRIMVMNSPLGAGSQFRFFVLALSAMMKMMLGAILLLPYN
jgi:hypothetical protein